MIPYSVTGKTESRPYATFSLVMLMLGVFVWEMWITAQAGQPIENLLTGLTLVTCEVGKVSPFETLLDGFRSIFLHMGFVEFVTNVLFLWVFAPLVEEYFGGKRFLAFFVMAGFGGHVASVLFNPGACLTLTGPAGAISGVLGAFLLLYPGKRISANVPLLGRGFDLPAFFFIVMYFFISVFAGEGGPLSGNVAPFWDEIGGFVTGIGIIFLATMFKPAPPVNPLEHLDRD